MNFNQIMLGGRVVRDPQVKFLPSQTQVCEFGIAVNRRFKTANGEEREETLFVDCTAFGKTGEIINQHFSKGKPIFVVGRLKMDQWEKDGQKRTKHTVTVDSFQFVGGKNDGGDSDDGGAVAAAAAPAPRDRGNGNLGNWSTGPAPARTGLPDAQSQGRARIANRPAPANPFDGGGPGIPDEDIPFVPNVM